MIIERLWLRSLRNFEELQWSLHPRCNVIVGHNGSGKTTLLEAIYLLSRGQSFRTRSLQTLIKFHQEQFIVHARSSSEDSIYLEKNLKNQTKIVLNDKRCHRFSDLAKMLPCQLFHQDLFQIIDASAQIRRRLLDWGLFYHHHDYAKIFQDFNKALQQRNQILKQQGNRQDLQAWEKPYVLLSEQIDTYRQQYVEQLHAALQKELSLFSLDFNCFLKYDAGWDTKQSLSLNLRAQETYDRKMGYTHSGPHHADLVFLGEQTKGKSEWSRGQQKLILILLKIAQIKLLKQTGLFLFDDLSAELDKQRFYQICLEIRKLVGQTFFTVLDDSAKELDVFADSRWFYLQDGKIVKTMDL